MAAAAAAPPSVEVFGRPGRHAEVDDDGGVACVALARRADDLVAAGGDDGSCRLWDLRAPRARAVRRLGPLPAPKARVAGCQAVAWGLEDATIFTARGAHVAMYDLRKSDAVLLVAPDASKDYVCPRPPAKSASTATGEARDAKTAEVVVEGDEIVEGDDEVNSLQVNPLDGSIVASRDDGRVSVISFAGAEPHTLWESPLAQSHANICVSASWGDLEVPEVVSGGLDCTVKCWSVTPRSQVDVDEVDVVKDCVEEDDAAIDDILWEFTADVYEPSTADSAAESATVSGAYAFNPPFVHSVSVSNARMAVGMGDGTLGYWVVGDEVSELVRFPAHRASVVKVALRDHGRRFISAGNDRDISVWRSPEAAYERPKRLAWRQHTHKPNDFCAPQDCSFIVLATTHGLLTKYVLA